MRALRTPDARFEQLSGYAFAPHYLEVDDLEGGTLRMHYVDEGPKSGPVVLMVHGEPTWSYLYRKMIPRFAAAGMRALAPDLIGFGRSDKPSERGDYSYARHVGWLVSWIEQLGLERITLVCQDWGSLLGLRIVGEHPARFARVVVGNGFLPTGDAKVGDAFMAWRKFSQEVPVFETGKIVSGGCATALAPEVIAGYDAPFPDESYKAGARQFPALVPITPDDPAAAANRKAWETLERFDKPFLTAFGDKDPITRGADRALQARIPGAQGQPHTTLRDAGHFLQEDKGEELADVAIAFVRSTGGG